MYKNACTCVGKFNKVCIDFDLGVSYFADPRIKLLKKMKKQRYTYYYTLYFNVRVSNYTRRYHSFFFSLSKSYLDCGNFFLLKKIYYFDS